MVVSAAHERRGIGSALHRDLLATVPVGLGKVLSLVLDNDPAREFAGEDEQLNRGIAGIKELLKKGTKELPKLPPFPKR